MKILRIICLPFLIALLLISGVTYAQSPAKKSYDKGVAYAIQGKFTKAKEEFEKVIKVDPFYLYRPAKHGLEITNDVFEKKIKTETAIYLFVGISYGNKGQYDRAIREFTKAIETNPKYAVAYNHLGAVYASSGQVERGIREFTKVIDIYPKDAGAYSIRGMVYFFKLGNKVKGCADFKKACELSDCENYYLVIANGDCP